MENTTTRNWLQVPKDAPLILGTTEESLNSTSLQNNSKRASSPVDGSKPISHWGSGCNTAGSGSVSPKYSHSVYVLSKEGNPLTPTKPSKARKLLRDKVAKPIWNKFGQFGIQMQGETGKVVPKTALGVDWGTKFEGYSVAVGKENNLSVMWKLPNKKNIVRKLEERRLLRRARRQRNCRRRESRFSNREKEGFIAPSQMVMVQSRMNAIREFFQCYPISTAAIEDVRFNHGKHRWGENFSTIEIGKTMIYDWIRERASLQLYTGYQTGDCREMYDYRKSGNKSAEIFNAHCSDALALATDVYAREHIEQGKFLVVDDTYQPVRRKLHKTQPDKTNIRRPYSSGNVKKIKKGTICNFGLIGGGTKNKIYIFPIGSNIGIGNKYRMNRIIKKIMWLSHKFNIINSA